MVGAQRPGAYVEGARVEGLGFEVESLRPEHAGEIVQRRRHPGMVRPQGFLENGQRPSIGGLGFGVAVLVVVEQPQVVQCLRQLGMIRAEGLLLQGGGPQEKRLRPGVLVPDVVEKPEIVQAGRKAGVPGTEPLGDRECFLPGGFRAGVVTRLEQGPSTLRGGLPFSGLAPCRKRRESAPDGGEQPRPARHQFPSSRPRIQGSSLAATSPAMRRLTSPVGWTGS